MMCNDWYVCVAQVCAYEHICICMCLYVSVSMSVSKDLNLVPIVTGSFRTFCY